MDASQSLSVGVAFLAGLAAFASPCFFPFIPGYLSYMLGMSLHDMRSMDASELRKDVLIHAAWFVAGFSVVFILLGLSATYLGSLLGVYRLWLQRIGGAVIILFGLQLLGVIKINFLAKKKQKKLDRSNKDRKYYKSAGTGAVFALAWTPCVGPILTSILLYAGTSDTMGQGALLLVAFSAGLAIPFMGAAFAVDVMVRKFNKMGHILQRVSFVSGILVIAMGVLLMTGYVETVSKQLIQLFN